VHSITSSLIELAHRNPFKTLFKAVFSINDLVVSVGMSEKEKKRENSPGTAAQQSRHEMTLEKCVSKLINKVVLN